MIKSTQQAIYFEARSLTDGTRVSGLTITALLSKDGGTATATTNSPAELGATGVYTLTLTATETSASTLAIVLSTATEGIYLPLLTDEPTDNTLIVDAIWDETLSQHTVTGSTASTLASVATATSSSAIAATVADIETAVATVGDTVDDIQLDIITIRSNVSAISGYTDELEAMVEDLPTASGIASAVWDTTSRTLTASPTDVSALATSVEVASVQTTLDAIPASVWGATTRTLSTSPTDITALATSAELAALQTHGDASWGTADITSVLGLLGRFTVSDNTLTTYGSDGTTVLHTYGLTRDEDGNITAVTEVS